MPIMQDESEESITYAVGVAVEVIENGKLDKRIEYFNTDFNNLLLSVCSFTRPYLKKDFEFQNLENASELMWHVKKNYKPRDKIVDWKTLHVFKVVNTKRHVIDVSILDLTSSNMVDNESLKVA